MVRLACIALLVSVAALPLSAQEVPSPEAIAEQQRRVEATLMDPPATGMMVTDVGADSQAAQAGIGAGEVIVSYGGVPVPDQEALTAAKLECEGQETVVVVIAGPGGERTVVLKPGPIGINCMPVAKGVPATRLPVATVDALDLSPLDAGPFEDWYAFHLEGKGKLGFEYARLVKTPDRLVLRREVAFDGGEQWGLNHFDVTVIADAGPRPDAVAVRFLSPLSSWLSVGRVLDGRRWLQRQSGAETEFTHPADLPRVPTYLVESLAAFLPREAGASYHFRPLTEATGTAGLRSALVGVGEEEVDAAGVKLRAFRVEWRSLGGSVAGTYWFAGPGHAAYVDYGDATAVKTTKEKALAGVPASLLPR